MARFEGVYVAIVTPFTESYEVDYKRLHELCPCVQQRAMLATLGGG